MRNQKLRKPVFCKSDKGELVGGEKEVLTLWRNHLAKLLNGEVEEKMV